MPPLVAVAYNLLVLRQQLLVVPTGNDSAVHLAYARWVQQQLHVGRLPLDGWFPNLQLGISAARHYQVFPDLATGLISGPFGVERTYTVLLYLLLATWPVTIYAGARLLGWAWSASLAAMLSPLITSVTGYGYEHSSYVWQGYGLYTQLWGMWLMPLAWGLTWQAIDRRRSLVSACLVLGLLVCCHFLSAYLALLVVGVWVVCVPSQIWRRVLRAALVVGGALAVAAWVLIPVFLDRAYTNNSAFVQGTFWQDSFGASTVIGWLAGGQLLDHGRWALITLAAAVGFAVSLVRFRMDARARALLGVLGLSLFLFAGRPTFGFVIGLLPDNRDLLLHRYLMGVQLAGILLAGVGLAHGGRVLLGAAERRVAAGWVKPAVAMAMVASLVAALAPAAIQVASADGLFEVQSAFQLAAEHRDGADVASLIDQAKQEGGGRIYAGDNADWGRDFKVGYLPVSAELLNHDADGVGFSLKFPSLVQDAEAQFDSRNPAQYPLFNVRYLLLPASLRPPVAASLISSRGLAALWRVDGSGYLEAVDVVPPPVSADRYDLGRKGAAFLRSEDLRQGLYHAVAFNRTPVPGGAGSGSVSISQPAGTINGQSYSAANGSFVAEVSVSRPAVVLLKIAFDPNWRITVDGAHKSGLMVLPGLLGVEVTPGSHRLAFRYEPFGAYPILLVVGVIGLLAVWRMRLVIADWEVAGQSQPLAN